MSRRLLVCSIVIIGLGCLSGGVGTREEPFAVMTKPLADVAAAPRPAVVRVATFLKSRRTALAEPEINRLAGAIVDEAQRAGLAPELVLAVIHVESSGNNFAISHVGAMGLMQLLPRTAKDVAKRIGIDWRGPVTLFDPVANVRLGISYLDRLIRRFGDVPTALVAYNEGPTRVASRLRRGHFEHTIYSNRVLATWQTTASRHADARTGSV